MIAAALATAFLVMLSGVEVAQAIESPQTIRIPAGTFIEGSDRAEREYAYQLDEAAYGHSRTRKWKWYESERKRAEATLPAYRITRTLITNRQYRVFVEETGQRAPNATRSEWEGYGLIHPYERMLRHAWHEGGYPDGKADHPVVMVSHDDAKAYAAWLSRKTGETWRLPTQREWEKAARGTEGPYYPWGNKFDETRLNSHDAGPFDTVPVASYPEGSSPYGVIDMAGQVFEWTSEIASNGKVWVKGGGSWDDSGCGICRAAARHTRPPELKHILIGFHLVRETAE